MAETELAELRRLLKLHHQHHLEKGAIGLPDGEGGWIEIDNGAEYSDSSLFEMTEIALDDWYSRCPAPECGERAVVSPFNAAQAHCHYCGRDHNPQTKEAIHDARSGREGAGPAPGSDPPDPSPDVKNL